MDAEVNLDQLTLKTRRLEYQDGLFDFLLAGVFIVLGGMQYLLFSRVFLSWFIEMRLANPELLLIGSVGLVALLILLLFGSRKGINVLRRRLQLSYKGDVRPLHSQVGWKVQVGAAALIIIGAIVGAFFFARGSIPEHFLVRSIPALSGIATGIVFTAMGISLGFKRYTLAGIAGGIFSTLLFWLPLGMGEGWGWLGFGWGILLIITGSWTFYNTLKERGNA
ncbi:MAG: hypothetical protein PVI78_11560 [Anaerolineales bacterium]|jgi:hypothetical protein